jgi:hypothetical protein
MMDKQAAAIKREAVSIEFVGKSDWLRADMGGSSCHAFQAAGGRPPATGSLPGPTPPSRAVLKPPLPTLWLRTAVVVSMYVLDSMILYIFAVDYESEAIS